MHFVCAGLIALALGHPQASPAPAGDSIAVRVQYKGKPVPGAKLWLSAAGARDDAPAMPGPLVADAAGVVHLPRAALRGRRGYANLFARGPDGRVGGRQLDTDDQAATVELRDGADWSGRVTGPDGKPVAGAEVAVSLFIEPAGPDPDGDQSYFSVPSAESERYRRTTDADGAFTIPGIPAALRVQVNLTRPGAADLIGYVGTDKPLALALAATGGVRLAFRGADAAATKGMGYSLNGPKAADKARPADGPPQFRVFLSNDLDGTANFSLAGLPPGDYDLSLGGGGAVPVMAKKLPKVTVTPGGTAEVAVELVKLAKTTGRVVDAETGKPIAGAEVGVGPANSEQRPEFPRAAPVKTDADGRYVVHAPAGFVVRVGGQGSYGWVTAAGYLASDKPTVSDAPLAAAGLTFPDIKLRKAATFAALITDADGKPVAASVYPSRVGGGFDLPFELAAGADGAVTIPGLDPNDLIALRARRGDAVNVPEAVEIGATDRQTIRLSRANACAVAGRVLDAAGKPLPGAKAALHWQYRGVGKFASMGTSRMFETLTADADGRFRSSALWPGDDYHVVVTAKGFGTAESEHVRDAKAGKTYDLALTLKAADLAVTGRVVDLAGGPVAGVRVFNRGDGEKPVETTTDAAGQFTLAGFRAGPAFVFAQSPGHRLAVAPADPAGAAVTLTLRKLADAPAPPPDLTAHRAALDALTRELFAAMWAKRDTLDGFERSLFTRLIPFDPALAKEAAAQAKAAGDKTDYGAYLKRADQDAKLLAAARDDPDDALALLADRKGSEGLREVLQLAKRLRATDPARGLRVAEDAVQRARTLDMPERAFYLAQAGAEAGRCGNAAGAKAIVAEAADLAEPLAAEGRNALYRGTVAAELAAFDRPRALKMIAAQKGSEPGRYLAQAIDRVAVADPAAAEKMLADVPAGNSFERYEARMSVAYRLAARDPDAAAKVMAGVTEEHYRTLGYYKLARLFARTDKPRAWKLLDTAFAEYDAATQEFDSWSYSGGRPALLAVGAVVARELDYPDVAGVVARALMHRPTGRRDSPQQRGEQAVKFAFALSFSDPAAARRVLASVAPPEEFARRAARGQRGDAFAAAFVTPEHAMKAVAPRLADFRNGRSGLTELFDALAAPDRLHEAARWESLPRVNNEWEE